MSTHKHINVICCAAFLLTLFLTALFANAEKFGVLTSKAQMGYETKLFDTSSVHTIDIVMDDWDSFMDSCENEEYEVCSVVIDNEAYKNVGIRAKGNTSLSSVAAYGNDRYSFKIEFDQYDDGKNYYGLDKLSLNNIIQDNTYMKDYLTYQMMGYLGVNASLCSFVYITVNGEDFGLYLAVESPEESFLERNYGSDYGELYKPDSLSMGGGMGNGEKPERNETSDTAQPPQGEQLPEDGQLPEDKRITGNGGGKTMGSDDVSLIYSDDDYDSYTNIFDNAKTDITETDKDRLIASLKAINEGENIEDAVNIEEVIRYFVVHNFVCNFDSYTGSMIHNYYLYEEDGKLSMIPWDYNLAFGGFMSGTDATSLVNYPIDTPVSGGTIESRPMLAWIFENEEYTQLYHKYFSEFITSYFDSGYFSEMIDSVTSSISSYVEKDPTKFCTYEEFETGAQALKEFCRLRAQSVSGQLDGSIPATSDSQSQDSQSLIDASDLSISDMGNMGNGNGMGRGKNTEPAQTDSAAADTAQTSQPPEQAADDSTESSAANPQAMQKPGQDNMQPPDTQTKTNYINYILLGISCIILIIALVFAVTFKRKK